MKLLGKWAKIWDYMRPPIGNNYGLKEREVRKGLVMVCDGRSCKKDLRSGAREYTDKFGCEGDQRCEFYQWF